MESKLRVALIIALLSIFGVIVRGTEVGSSNAKKFDKVDFKVISEESVLSAVQIKVVQNNRALFEGITDPNGCVFLYVNGENYNYSPVSIVFKRKGYETHKLDNVLLEEGNKLR